MTDEPTETTARSAVPLVAAAALILGGLVFIVVWILGGLIPAIVAGLVVAGIVAFVVVRYADRIVLRLVHAEPLPDGAEPRIEHLVHSLCLVHGIAEPELWIVDDPALNALMTATNADASKLVFTQGMLDSLDRLQLEGVVGHLLSRVQSGEVVTGTIVTVVVGLPLAPVPSLRDKLLDAYVQDQADVAADFGSAALTQYPPGLISALMTLDEHDSALRFPARAARHLWFDDPDAEGSGRIHTPRAERIEMLQEL